MTDPGTDLLEPVRTGFDLGRGLAQRLPQSLFQVVLGKGHAVTSLPAAS